MALFLGAQGSSTQLLEVKGALELAFSCDLGPCLLLAPCFHAWCHEHAAVRAAGLHQQEHAQRCSQPCGREQVIAAACSVCTSPVHTAEMPSQSRPGEGTKVMVHHTDTMLPLAAGTWRPPRPLHHLDAGCL